MRVVKSKLLDHVSSRYRMYHNAKPYDKVYKYMRAGNMLACYCISDHLFLINQFEKYDLLDNDNWLDTLPTRKEKRLFNVLTKLENI